MLHLSLTFSDILTHILMVTLRQRIAGLCCTVHFSGSTLAFNAPLMGLEIVMNYAHVADFVTIIVVFD